MPPRAKPAGDTGPAAGRRELLTLAEVCDELKISMSTWYEWRDRGDIPRTRKLPNGGVRVDRIDLNRWLDSRPEAA